MHGQKGERSNAKREKPHSRDPTVVFQKLYYLLILNIDIFFSPKYRKSFLFVNYILVLFNC